MLNFLFCIGSKSHLEFFRIFFKNRIPWISKLPKLKLGLLGGGFHLPPIRNFSQIFAYIFSTPSLILFANYAKKLIVRKIKEVFKVKNPAA